MLRSIRELVQYRALLKNLVARDIKVRYRRSFLGVLWTMLNPLLMMIVFSIVFSSVFRFTIAHFAIYFLSAYLLWTFVSQTTSWSTACLLGHAALIRRIYMPKEIFIVATVLSGLVNLLMSLVPLALIMLVVHHPFHVSLTFLPIPILIALVFTLGMSFFLASVCLEFNDVVQIYQALLLAWMYLTPIVYPLEAIPERFHWIVRANPMYYLVEAFRQPIYVGVLPGARTVAYAAAWGFTALVGGWWLFERRADRIAYLV
jgi:ABC-2 type transport system permease protein